MSNIIHSISNFSSKLDILLFPLFYEIVYLLANDEYTVQCTQKVNVYCA